MNRSRPRRSRRAAARPGGLPPSLSPAPSRTTRKIWQNRPLRLILSVLIAVTALGGCGKKGDPEPPIRMIPATPAGLETIQRDARLLLSFPYPSTTVAGTPLSGIDEVAVWRLLWSGPPTEGGAPPQIDQRQFTAGARPDVVLEGDALADAVRGDRIELTLPMPEPDEPPGAGNEAVVTLAVKTQGPTGEESAFSNLTSFVIREAPDPPTGLEIEGRNRGVEIRWEYPETAPAESAEEEAPAEEAAAEETPEETTEPEAEESAMADTAEPEAEEDGGAAGGIRGFNVYRRLATERTYGEPVRTVGRKARKVVDEGALFGTRYIYTVTAVERRRPALVESGFGGEAEIDYRDRFPPPVPAGLVALAQGDRVRVVWRPVEASDLAGYRVYRRSPASQEFAPLTGDPVTAAELIDRDVRSGASYTYRVTAVDREGNESDASEQVTAAVR